MSDLLPDRTLHRHGYDWLIRSLGGTSPTYYIHSDTHHVIGPFVAGVHDPEEMIDVIADLDWIHQEIS